MVLRIEDFNGCGWIIFTRTCAEARKSLLGRPGKAEGGREGGKEISAELGTLEHLQNIKHE